MGTYYTTTYPTSRPPCSHLEGSGAPACWDCAEEGHVNTPSVAEEEGIFKKFRRSLGFRDSHFGRNYMYSTGAQDSTLEVRLPEEGIEVGAPSSRRSQPGLIVVTGPQVVSPEEKFRKPEAQSWSPEPNPKDDTASDLGQTDRAVSEPDRKIWGLRRRTFQILVVVVILALAGVIIGIAVGVTQQNRVLSTSLSSTGGGQVSSSHPPTPPITATMTVSYYVTGGSSTFVTLFETERPSSSRQASSVVTLNTISTTATGKGGSEDDEPATIAVTTTAFVVGQQPPLTDTIRSQPTVTVSIPPPPPRTSPSSPASTPHTSSRDCIGDEGSVYTDPGTGDKFKISCAIAHQGMDIMNLKAETMEACINLCAKNNRCKGAVWYNVGPQGTDLNYCWLKSGMNGEVRETQDAQSVTLL